MNLYEKELIKAHIFAMAMYAANMEEEALGMPPVYDEEDFCLLLEDLDHLKEHEYETNRY